MSGLWSSRNLFLYLVRKHLQFTIMIILDNFGVKNCLKKSVPGDVRAQVLQESVGASHADQGQKSGMPSIFSDPGGQEESNGTPYLGCWCNPEDSPGGSLFNDLL